jgi:hypothetical protein
VTAEEWEKKWGSLPQEPQESFDMKQGAQIERLKVLCARAADALEEEFGSPGDPNYGVRGPVHELISELRKAVE